jgi:hypothetical protein
LEDFQFGGAPFQFQYFGSLLPGSGICQRAHFFDKCFLFLSVITSRVLHKVKFGSPVKWLTDLCTPMSLGRWRDSGRASRNLWVIQEFIAWLLIILGWGLSRLFVAMAKVIKLWSDSAG